MKSNNFLFQRQDDTDRPNIVKGPLYNLYKYKVIKIISSSGMLVLHSELQQIYYIKVKECIVLEQCADLSIFLGYSQNCTTPKHPLYIT